MRQPSEMVKIALVFASILAIVHSQTFKKSRSVHDLLKNDPNFSNFYRSIKDKSQICTILHYHNVTVFAPENAAFLESNFDYPDERIQYHASFDVKTLDSLNSTRRLESLNSHNPPLWISTKSWGIYVDNALISAEIAENPIRNQVLLKIDEVLDTKMKSPGVKNPSAFDFLQNYYKWDLGYGNEVGIFSEKVKKNRKLTKLYASEGFSTFFVPVDGGLDYPKLRELDRHIIEGHIIPNHVLFTRPAEKNFVFDTLADSDFLNIVLTLEKGEPNTLVKSSTIFGSAGHRKGEVVAEIVVPNIPVSNGVIHLISRPLGIFKRELTVFPLLSTKYKIESDPEISLTSEYGEKSNLNDFLSNEEGDRKLTYFVPNDTAWKRLFAIFGSNPLSGKTSGGTNAKIREILGRHLIVSTTKWFKIDDLVKRSKNFNNETVIGTASGPMRLQFVKNWDDYHIMWNGKRINVIRADYECLDGIVHIIDGVFVDLVEFENIRTREEGGFWAILKDMVRRDRDSNN